MVLNEWAFEMDSEVFIHIDDAVKSRPYRCTNSNCKLEVRRRAGSKEMHFYHLNPNKQNPCGGGEGPKHKKAKEMIAKWLSESGDYATVKTEERIGKYVVDIFLQTKYGPFYFEVIDTHPPEEEKWEQMEGRIIPFWISRYGPDVGVDDCMILDKALETLRYHFELIDIRVIRLSKSKSKSLEESWFDQGIHGVFRYVQDQHRECEGDFPSLWALTQPKKPRKHTHEELLEAFKKARKKLRKKENRALLHYRGWD